MHYLYSFFPFDMTSKITLIRHYKDRSINEATNNGATQNKHYFIHKRNSISNRTLQYSNKSVGDIFNNRKYSNRKSKINRQIT